MFKFKKESLVVFIIVILNCILMVFIDGVFSANYLQKSIFKIIIFMLLPLLYLKKHHLDEIKNIFKVKRDNHSIFKSFALGIGVYLLIVGSYFTIGNYFNFNQITSSLENGIGVNSSNFIFVALYISFINSLLEEFFFRGYAFIYLKNIPQRKYLIF